MLEVSGLCRCFTCENLGREGECVHQEQPGEFLKLFNLCCREFYVVMRTLVSVETDQVRPFLQISSNPSTTGKKVDALRQEFSCKRWIKFTCCRINSLSEHGGSCVCIAAPRVVEPLDKGSLNCRRDICWSFKGNLLRILSNNRRICPLEIVVKISWESIHPARSIGRVEEADAANLAASIARKHCRAQRLSRGNIRNQLHGDVGGAAVRAISNKGYRHIHSIGARDWAARGNHEAWQRHRQLIGSKW